MMRIRRLHHRAPRGVALIVTLAAVLLLTMLIITFFTRSTLNRQIAFSSTNLLKADFVAHSAMDILVGELRHEITDENHSDILASGTTYGRNYYLPKTAQDLLPRPSGLASPMGSLLKVSAAGTAFGPDSNLSASGASTSASSRNGRSITAARWFTGQGSPQLGRNDQVPNWLLMTRDAGVKTPSLSDATSPESGDFVIGRFAYSIYDVGGLLNANVAGYPSAAAAGAPFKASAAYADLSALGMTSADAFIQWRNATTGASAATFQQWADGIRVGTGSPDEAALAVARGGHRTSVQGDNAVFSRGDLLDNPDLQGGAANLTHFNVADNTPPPTTSTPAYANSGTAVHYLDDGTETTIEIAAGDLLPVRRFSLAKLAWLTSTGPAAGISEEAIQSCFGLRWNNAEKRWDYVGASAGNVQSAIATLADVAAHAPVREPNFFEMLKAGIDEGSIGRAAQWRTLALDDQMTREAVPDLQLLRIGANIIDCADSDNFPTTLAMSYAGLGVPVHGVEDLPYLYGLSYGRISGNFKVDRDTQEMTYCSLLMAPLLFNPHAVASTASMGGPNALRVRIADGSLTSVYWQPLGNGLGTPLARTPSGQEQDLSTRPSIIVPSSQFDFFRDTVSTIRSANATSSTRLSSFESHINAIDGEAHGFRYYTYTGLPEQYDSDPAASPAVQGPFVVLQRNLLIVLEYQDTAGWHVYDQLAGNEGFLTSGIAQAGGAGDQLVFDPGLVPVPDDPVKYPPGSNARSNNVLGDVTFKMDPRTTRWVGGKSSSFLLKDTNVLPGSTSKGMTSMLPFGTGKVADNPAPTGIYPGLWAEGNKASWTGTDGPAITNIVDNDGVTRPADGWLGGGAANLFRAYTDMARRPVILQRPFRSVGELGYVFRDTPWKSLSFFDATSGDGDLLEYFAVADAPAVTGSRVNLAGRESLTRKALLEGVGQASDGSNALADAESIAEALETFCFDGQTARDDLPLNVGDLARFMSSTQLDTALPPGAHPVKNQREAVVRALAGSSQSRTWNLLIDVIAQTGRYPQSATSLDDFMVEGQQRYWLSVAIDRYTGKVLARQLEVVDE